MQTAAVQPNPHLQALWWLITITALVSAAGGVVWSVWLIRVYFRDGRRQRDGLCLKCGYDLRQTRNRCPECGEPVEPTRKK